MSEKEYLELQAYGSYLDPREIALVQRENELERLRVRIIEIQDEQADLDRRMEENCQKMVAPHNGELAPHEEVDPNSFGIYSFNDIKHFLKGQSKLYDLPQQLTIGRHNDCDREIGFRKSKNTGQLKFVVRYRKHWNYDYGGDSEVVLECSGKSAEEAVNKAIIKLESLGVDLDTTPKLLRPGWVILWGAISFTLLSGLAIHMKECSFSLFN